MEAARLLLPFGTKLPAHEYAQNRAGSQQESPHNEHPKPCIVTGGYEPRGIRDGTAGGVEIGVRCEHVHRALRRFQGQHQRCSLHLTTCQECEVPVARGTGPWRLYHLAPRWRTQDSSRSLQNTRAGCNQTRKTAVTARPPSTHTAPKIVLAPRPCSRKSGAP